MEHTKIFRVEEEKPPGKRNPNNKHKLSNLIDNQENAC